MRGSSSFDENVTISLFTETTAIPVAGEALSAAKKRQLSSHNF